MILFEETRPATLDDVRWLRQNLRRRLEDSCLRSIEPKLRGKSITLPLIDSVLLAVTEIANTIVQHASPKPQFLTLEVRLIASALRIEFRDDGGGFDNFGKVLESTGRLRASDLTADGALTFARAPCKTCNTFRVPLTASWAGANCAKPSSMCSSWRRTLRIAAVLPPC